MNDREKIIKGLQCIIDGTVRCESCGYAIDKHGHYSCQQNCASDAIALLKEQEEKPLRCDKCSHHREDGWCGMHGQWVKETDYCSWGAWEGR